MELVVEALLTDLEPANPLIFEIERGHIGSTRVEISSYTEETPTVVAVLTWDGINAGNREQLPRPMRSLRNRSWVRHQMNTSLSGSSTSGTTVQVFGAALRMRP